MAPEQLRGEVDRRTDVYALGLLLYEALALRPAYDPLDPRLVANVATAAFVPVEERNPARPVPPDLAEACRKAAGKDPDERFQTARQMGTTLRAWLDGTSERERRHREAEAYAAKGKEAVAAYERAKETSRSRSPRPSSGSTRRSRRRSGTCRRVPPWRACGRGGSTTQRGGVTARTRRTRWRW
jgi:serine/threonine protein kinase